MALVSSCFSFFRFFLRSNESRSAPGGEPKPTKKVEARFPPVRLHQIVRLLTAALPGLPNAPLSVFRSERPLRPRPLNPLLSVSRRSRRPSARLSLVPRVSIVLSPYPPGGVGGSGAGGAVAGLQGGASFSLVLLLVSSSCLHLHSLLTTKLTCDVRSFQDRPKLV